MNYADVELPSNKKFGLFFAAVFLLSSAYFANEGAYVLTLLFVVLAVTFALIAFTKSEMLLPFNRLWMRFGLLIGMIVSPIVLGAIFFVIFTPLGFVMRLFGRDENFSESFLDFCVHARSCGLLRLSSSCSFSVAY